MPTEDTVAVPLTCRLIRDGRFRGWVEMPRFALVDEHTYSQAKKSKDSNGNEVNELVPVTLNSEELARIVSVCNRRISETGDFSPCVIGHTDDNLPTKFQPSIAGFAKDFAVEPLINPETGEKVGRLAIYATPFAKPENLNLFLEHPRRSVELYFDEGSIDPISLLSSETPARDLGLHKFSASESVNSHREKPYRYSVSFQPHKESPEKNMNDIAAPIDTATKPVDDPVVSKVFESDRWKQMESSINDIKGMLQSLAGGAGGPVDDPATAGGDMSAGVPEASGMDQGGLSHDDLLGPSGEHGFTPESLGEPGHEYDPELELEDHDDDFGDDKKKPKKKDDKDFDDEEKDEDFDDEDEDEKDRKKSKKDKKAKCEVGDDDCEPDRMSAASAPGANNGYLPGGKKKMARNESVLEDPIREARTRQDKARFAKLEARINELEANNAKLNEQKDIAEVQSLLSGLDSEGLAYEAEYELPRLVRMSKAERTAHIDYLRRVCRPIVPGNGKFPVPDETQAKVRFSKSLQQENAGAGFSSPVEAVECGREAAIQSAKTGKSVSPLEVLQAKRGTNGTNAGGVTKVR